MQSASLSYWFERQSRFKWTQAFCLLAGMLAVCLIYSDTLLELHHRWVQWDQAYSHGYILIVLCLFFIVKNGIVQSSGVPNAKLALFALFPAFVSSFGYATQTSALVQLSLPFYLSVLLLALVGWRVFFSIFFILSVLLLAIPVWEVLLPPLRNMTAWVSTQGVRVLGIPAFIDGFSFSLPYGTVLIAGSCAGLSYFLMGVVLASLNAVYREYSLKHALLSIALLAALSILGNWVRVFALILIAYYTKMESSLVADHGQFGWWIFASVFFIYLFLVRNFPERGRFRNQPASESVSDTHSLNALKSLLVFLVVGLSLPMFWVMNEPKGAEYDSVKSSGLSPIPFARVNQQLRLDYHGYDDAEFYQFRLQNNQILVGRLVYETQKPGKELISSGNSLTDKPVELITSEPVTVYKTTVGSPIVYRSKYLVGARTESNKLKAKWFQFWEKLQGRHAVALWVVATSCSQPNCSEAIALLNSPAISDDLLEAFRLY